MSSSTPRHGSSVLFVCLGNICRSTMAEAVFRNNLTSNTSVSTVDSCGTGAYHEAAPPDPRTMAVLKKNGIRGYTHSARKIRTSDFDDFDYILAMDADNLEDLQEMRQRIVKKRKTEDGLGKVLIYGHFGGKSKDEGVVDPYYGANNGFDIAFEQMQRFSKGLIKHLQEDK